MPALPEAAEWDSLSSSFATEHRNCCAHCTHVCCASARRWAAAPIALSTCHPAARDDRFRGSCVRSLRDANASHTILNSLGQSRGLRDHCRLTAQRRPQPQLSQSLQLVYRVPAHTSRKHRSSPTALQLVLIDLTEKMYMACTPNSWLSRELFFLTRQPGHEVMGVRYLLDNSRKGADHYACPCGH